jgi:hypothetical protein
MGQHYHCEANMPSAYKEPARVLMVRSLYSQERVTGT